MLNLIRRSYPITQFSNSGLSISGMRNNMIYEIICNGENAELSVYEKFYGKEERKLKRKATCSVEEVVELLNTCKIPLWDGFHGKHPRHVKDGTMFSFTAVVNKRRTIRASGSQNFPKRFKIFYGWLREKVS